MEKTDMKIAFLNFYRAYEPNFNSIKHYFDLGESGGRGVRKGSPTGGGEGRIKLEKGHLGSICNVV